METDTCGGVPGRRTRFAGFGHAGRVAANADETHEQNAQEYGRVAQDPADGALDRAREA